MSESSRRREQRRRAASCVPKREKQGPSAAALEGTALTAPGRIKLNVSEINHPERQFEQKLDQRVIGQRRAKRMAARAYRRFLSNTRDPRTPVYVAYLVGDSTVGKSLMARAMALAVHGDEDAYVKVNCGALKERHQLMQIIGAPPSYVGYSDPDEQRRKAEKGRPDASALLSEANQIASRKGSRVGLTIVLLDEVEKMHEEVEDVFLAIFRDGCAEMANNVSVSFRNCIFLMTSNLATKRLSRRAIGFAAQESRKLSTEETTAIIMAEMERRYKSEFLKRLDEIVVFEPLSEEELWDVVNLEISLLQNRLVERLPRGKLFALKVHDSAKRFLLDQALSNNGDISALKRAINRHICDHLDNELIKGSIPTGSLVEAVHEEGADDLSLYVEGGVIPHLDAERFAGEVVETEESQKGLAFQRALALAHLNPGKEGLYEISVDAGDLEILACKSAELARELKEIFHLAIVRMYQSCEAPLVCAVTVRSGEMVIELVRKHYPQARVRRLPTGQGLPDYML